MNQIGRFYLGKSQMGLCQSLPSQQAVFTRHDKLQAGIWGSQKCKRLNTSLKSRPAETQERLYLQAAVRLALPSQGQIQVSEYHYEAKGPRGLQMYVGQPVAKGHRAYTHPSEAGLPGRGQ